MDGDIFENAPRVDANLFEKRIKKDAFSKISKYVWTGPETYELKRHYDWLHRRCEIPPWGCRSKDKGFKL